MQSHPGVPSRISLNGVPRITLHVDGQGISPMITDDGGGGGGDAIVKGGGGGGGGESAWVLRIPETQGLPSPVMIENSPLRSMREQNPNGTCQH